MSGPKRNADKLNTIGIVVVGICGAVLVYVTIVALQAFYMNDTSDIQNTADYSGQDSKLKGMKSDQMRNITEYAVNGAGGTYRIPVEMEMAKIVDAADPKNPAGMWTPAVGMSKCRTTMAIPGRGHPDPAPGAIDGCPGAKAAPAAPTAGSDAGSAAGSGSTAAGSAPAPATDFPATKVLFDSGKSALPAAAADSLQAVAAFLRANPGAKVQLSGFVDKTGPADVNKELAKRRAFAVRDALKAAGIAADRVVLQKPGDLTGGDGEQARRVEIGLYVEATAAPAAASAEATGGSGGHAP